MTRLRSFAASALQARRRPSIFASRATTDKSSFGGARSAGSRVRRRIETAVTTVVAVVIGGSSSVLACPMCFGAEESSLIDGAKLGIIVMLGLTFAVQGAFVGFFLYLRRRAKRIAELDLDTEWSELQKASRTS